MTRTVNCSRAIENTPLRNLFLVVVGLLLAPVAQAGIKDTPVPNLNSDGKTKTRYSVPGVTNNAGMGTYFACTSTSLTSQVVGVEVFGAAGGGPLNDATTSKFTLAAGATVLFGTGDAVGLTVDEQLGISTLNNGSARVISNSSSIICTAHLAEKIHSPPSTMNQLTVVKAVTQKGD